MEEWKYKFRQPLPCLACAPRLQESLPYRRVALNSAGGWLHLPCSQIPDAPHSQNTRSLTFDKPFAPLLFCGLSVFLYLTHPTLRSPATKPLHRELLASLLMGPIQCSASVRGVELSKLQETLFCSNEGPGKEFFPPFTGANGTSTSAFNMNQLCWTAVTNPSG